MTPPVFPPTPQSPEIETGSAAALDRDHLRLLEIGYYILSGLTVLAASFLLFQFGLFLFAGLHPQIFTHPTGSGGRHSEQPPAGILLAVAGFTGIIILLGWTFGALLVYAGRSLKKRHHTLFIKIMAGLACLFAPLGTFLGICTFLVMQRPSVKALFN